MTDRTADDLVRAYTYYHAGDRVHRTAQYREEAQQILAQARADAARDAVEQLAEAFQLGGWSDSVLPALRRRSHGPSVPAIAISQAVTDWHRTWIATHHPKDTP